MSRSFLATCLPAETAIRQSPKTRTSIRSIPLNSELRSVLLDLRNRRHRSSWIFSDSKGNPLDYSVFLKKWYTIQKAAKVAVRSPHQTPHFFATELLARGGNVIEVSRTLGHANIAITVDVYAKWIPPARQAVVDVLSEPVETQHAVAGLLLKKTRQSAEKSGKRGTQTIESNEISALEKLLVVGWRSDSSTPHFLSHPHADLRARNIVWYGPPFVRRPRTRSTSTTNPP